MSKYAEEFADKYQTTCNLRRITKELIKEKLKDKSTLKLKKTRRIL